MLCLNILEHGQFAELPHIGKTKHFIETGFTEWYIPVGKVERTLNYPIVTFGEQQYYVATGARANRFMTDAEFKTRYENKEIVGKALNSMFKEVCR